MKLKITGIPLVISLIILSFSISAEARRGHYRHYYPVYMYLQSVPYYYSPYYYSYYPYYYSRPQVSFGFYFSQPRNHYFRQGRSGFYFSINQGGWYGW